MKFFHYTLLALFALLVIPGLAMIGGVVLEKLMVANLFLQAIAFCMCAYGITKKRERKLRILYGGYISLILIYYAIALMLASAPIPEQGFG